MDRIASIEGLYFPLRPPPEPDESYLGYVLRLVAENGVKLRRGYSARIFGADLPRLPIDQKCIAEAVRLSGTHGAWLKQAAYHAGRHSRPGKELVSFRGQFVRRSWLALGNPRVCLQCLREGGGHHRFLWDFRLFRRCLIHGTVLTSKCKNCGDELTWSRWLDLQTEDFRCICGYRLLDLDGEVKSNPLSSGRHCTAGRFLANRIAPEVYPTWHRELHPDIARLPLEAIVELCLYLGAIADQASARKRGRFSPTSAGYVENRVSLGVKIVSGWPTAFHRTLRQLVEKNIRRGRTSVKTVLGSCAQENLLEDLGAAERLVRAELVKFQESSFFADEVLCRKRPARGTYIRLSGTIGSSQALDVLKLSPSSLRCLLRIAKREGVEHSLHAGQWWFNADQVHAVAKTYSVLVDLKQIGEIIGVGPHMLSELRRSFHLRLVMRSVNGRRALTCEAEEFERLIEKVGYISQNIVARGGYLQGKEAARVFSRRGLSCADLVDAIMDDMLQAVRIVGSDPNTGRLYFEKMAVHEVARQLSSRSTDEPRWDDNGY